MPMDPQRKALLTEMQEMLIEAHAALKCNDTPRHIEAAQSFHGILDGFEFIHRTQQRDSVDWHLDYELRRSLECANTLIGDLNRMCSHITALRARLAKEGEAK